MADISPAKPWTKGPAIIEPRRNKSMNYLFEFGNESKALNLALCLG